MKIVIAGGHGQIALLIQRQLADLGHEGIGLIRNPQQGADLQAVGGTPLVFDLESSTPAELAAHLKDVDAVVFAAGAGPGSTAERKLTVDLDGAVLLADAALLAGVRRYVMVSAIDTDTFDAKSDDVYQVYLRAKSEADAAVRGRDLDWTIVRPGGLVNDPGTGLVTLAPQTGRSTIPRQDVAAIVVASLSDPHSIGKQFEAITGETPIADAVAAVESSV